jgi:WS/DGAT/MGAT family acyltransferase
VQQLSGQDASFLYFETPNSAMHVGSVAIYDQSTVPGGRVRFQDILSHIESRLPKARAFRQRLVPVPFNADHPYWIEDGRFDLEFHVRHIALPEPGDWRQLCIQAARLHSRPLDLSRPLWEFTVISGLDGDEGLPPGCFALVSKIHHAAIDGVSGAELTAAIHDTSPTGDDLPPVEDNWRPEPEPNPWTLMGRATLHNATQPFHFARVLGRTVPAVGRVMRAVNRQGDRRNVARVPRARFNGTVSPHRVLDGRSFDLATVRQVRQAVPGATVNDVVLTIVGGALRTYLGDKGELPDAPLVAMAPISVRSADQVGTAGNQVSGMIVPLGTDVADPAERLAAVHRGTTASKELTEAIGARLLTDYSQFIPASVAGRAARLSSRMGLANRGTPMYNCVVTNVPGPQEPLYMNGARMVALYGMGPVADGSGLINAVFSYCGGLTVSFTSCRELMGDPAAYAEALQGSYESLCAATDVKPRPAPTMARARGASAGVRS